MISGRLDLVTDPVRFSGDFWYRQISDADQRHLVAQIASVVDVCPSLFLLRDQIHALHRPGEPRVHGARVRKIDRNRVMLIGPDLQRRITTLFGDEAGIRVARTPDRTPDLSGWTAPLVSDSGGRPNLLGPFGELWLVPVRRSTHEFDIDPLLLRPRWVLPWEDRENIPYVIRSAHGTLVLGFGFRWRDDALVFDESPDALFPEGLVEVLVGVDFPAAAVATAFRVGHGRGGPVLEWLRSRPTARNFAAAIADWAGLPVAAEDDRITSSHELPDRQVLYCTEKGHQYRQPLPVSRLPNDTLLQRLDVLGGVVTVEMGAGSMGDWWRRDGLSYPRGLELQGMAAIPGLVLPDAPIGVWRDGEDLRFSSDRLDAATWAKFEYWLSTRRLDGVPPAHPLVADFLGLEEMPEDEPFQINPIDFWLTQHRQHSCIVRFDPLVRGAAYERAVAFLHEHGPTWLHVFLAPATR